MKYLNGGLMALSLAVFLGGCAHPITISPNITKLQAASMQTKIDKSVGYYISEGNRALSVTTPAGGGDSVKYTPYADIESGLYAVLSNVFSNAYVVKDPKDRAFLQSKNISWIFTPTITTDSSSRNSFFWPPTDFTVTLDCIAADGSQQEVWRTHASANNDLIAVKETIKDHGLAGGSATEKALLQLQEQIVAAPEFRK